MASERWGPARMGCDQRTLHDEAEEKQRPQGQHERRHEGQADAGGEDEGGVGAGHDEIAVAEIHHGGGLVDDGHGERHDGVKHARRDAAHDQLRHHHQHGCHLPGAGSADAFARARMGLNDIVNGVRLLFAARFRAQQ